LAAENRLREMTHLSTVSGGSLCAGLVYSANDYRWPNPDEFYRVVVPRIAQLVTQHNLQSLYLRGILRNPLSFFRPRANDISYLIRTLWGIDASLQDLSTPNERAGQPHWHIVTTCYETAKGWYFSKDRMGDYIFGYHMRPDVPISDVMAASSAVPGLIGPLVLDARRLQWLKLAQGQPAEPVDPLYDHVHLWDGGVYDNLGLEPLTNYSGIDDSYEYRPGIDFLLVSDAAGVARNQAYGSLLNRGSSAMRLVDIMKDQVRALRSRATIAYIKMAKHPYPPGRYFQIDNSAAQMFRRAYRTPAEVAALARGYFPPEKASQLAAMSTTLKRLSPTEFSDLYRHGFEVADVTLHAFDTERFPLLRYMPDQHPPAVRL
jgi:NTE family protein